MALTSATFTSLARPWVGVVVAYVFVILTPQSIWWWAFQGLRPVLWILLPTVIGFLVAAARGNIDFETVQNRRTVFALILWLFYTLSFYFGPYVDEEGPYRFTDPEWAASTINKIFFLYFLALLCIDEVKKLTALVWVMIGSAIYLVYWANYMYLSGQVFGRMPGPTNLGGGGIYADQNNFAMLFVVALPFLWYIGYLIRNRLLRWSLWLVIPFGWHAVFLTGSRGGLVGIAVTLMMVIWRSKNKGFAMLLLPAFVIAYMWQAGDVMRDRAGTISQFETEASAAGRLDAWGAALNMMVHHPLTGVGLASFGPAFPDHSSRKPREAHNTFFQISAESGIVAGSMYIALVLSNLLALWQNGKKLRERTDETEIYPLYWINEAILVGFTGLVVCSLFLSLQLFEIFFCLSVMTNAILLISRRLIKQDDIPRRWRGGIPATNSGALKFKR